MSDELKPCPFCGGSEIYAEEYEHHPGAMRWRVFCAGCMAGVDTGTRQSADAAVQDWNRRAERTCRMGKVFVYGAYKEYPDECYECTECGYTPEDENPRYCPNCGAKVVVE